MISLIHGRRTHFFAPDTGGSSGGGAAAPAAQGQTSNGEGKSGDAAPPADPFKDLPWDELDDVTKAQLEKVRDAHVATLQRSTKLEADLKRTDGIARSFQSQLDRLKADAEKRQQPPEKDEYLESVKDQLRKSGFNPDEVEKMAPIFAGMFKNMVPQLKREIGQDLLPLANTVMGREAEAAFMHARNNDPLGMLNDPNVAGRVWEMVQERVKNNEPTNFGIVSNLAKIVWADLQAEQKLNPDANRNREANLNLTPPALRTGMSYPGGNNAPTFTPPPDPNAAKTTLNSDTEAALATTFRHM
jgi:hypothetical protein